MRPRPSCSAEEDDNSEVAPATSLQPDDNGKRRSFTSAKYDGKLYADTLDRRKGEKVVSPAPPLQNARDMSPAPTQASGKPLQITKPVIQDETLEKMPGLPSTRRFRRQSPWACSLRTIIATLFSAVSFIAIYHSFKTRQLDPKGCEICYMSPVYVHLKDFDSEHTRFASKYSLHLYREQGIDDFEGDPKVGPSQVQLKIFGLMHYSSRVSLSSSYLETQEVIDKFDRWLQKLRNTSTTVCAIVLKH